MYLPRLAALAVVMLSLMAAACSSPTSPTPPTPPVTTPTPPAALSIACPANQTTASQTGNPVAVSFAPPTTSGGVAPVQVSCTRASGSLFPVGSTPVQCAATDAAAVTTSCAFTVNVTPPPPQLSRTKFLAFGDSMTAGEVTFPTSDGLREGSPNLRLVLVPAASYPTQLLSRLRARYPTQAALLDVTNAGVPSEWAEDGAVRLPRAMSSLRPDAVLLLEGINELYALGAPGVQRAWAALDLMAKEIRGRGARAFIATLPPPRPAGSRLVPLALIQALNANIRVTARGEGAVLVDLYEALSTDVNRYIGLDGIHPTEAGYQKMAETFYDAIRLDLEVR